MSEQQSLHQLQQLLLQLNPIDVKELVRIEEFCTSVSFDVGDYLYRADTEAKQIFFLASGLVRVFYLCPSGRESNKSFLAENQFAGAITYPDQAKTCRYSIQALEPTQTLSVPLTALENLYRSSLTWADIGRRYMTLLALKKEQREGEFLLDNAETRYLRFLEQYPGLVDRLPLYHIASYLGITDVALSRIRRGLK